MNKYDYLSQPKEPRLVFLIDFWGVPNRLGATSEIDKIEYNLNLMEDYVKLGTEIYDDYSINGTTSVFPVGRFITILQLMKGRQSGCMTFFEFNRNKSSLEMKEVITESFGIAVAEEVMKINWKMIENFKGEDDLVELIIP
jgi:hypothetical protein